MLITFAPMLAACTTARASVLSVPAFTLSSELGSAGGGLTCSKARDDCRIEMMVAYGATPTTPSGAPGGGGGTAGSSSVCGSGGPLEGIIAPPSSGGGGGGGTVWVIVTGVGGGGGRTGGGTSTGGGGAALTAGGPAGGGNAGVAGMGRGIGKIPCGAAPMIELTTVPWASQSDRPSSPMM